MTGDERTSAPSPTELRTIARAAADLAARHVRASAGTARSARTKSTLTDVVTQVDIETEELIRHELLARCPGSAIVGEELDDLDGSTDVGWIVDPIDGTVNFLYDLPVVGVSIAATVEGTVVAGAVADVHRGETFSAARHAGAQLDDRPIATSTQDDLALSLVATGFSYHADLRAEQAAVVASILPRVRDVRCMGSAALNLCWVAAGRFEAYYERDLKVYDYAAGALIASESGADVTVPSSSTGDLVVAVGPHLAAELRSLIADAGPVGL